MTNRSFYITGAAALAIAVCLHLFFFSRGFYSISWDESGRILDAHAWAVHGIFQTKAWLPFYRICVGLGLMVYPDLVLTPRMITFVFGLASIPAVGWLAHELFQSRKTTHLTLILSAFFSQRVALSLAPLSDIMFIFLIVVTIALFARWMRSDKRGVLLLCGVSGALTATLRYEGWVFGVVLFMTAACSRAFVPQQAKRTGLLLFGLILFFFPAVWGLGTFFAVNPLGIVAANAKQYTLSQILRKNPLVEFGYMNVLSLNFLGILAVLQFIRKGGLSHRALIAVSFSPLLIASLVLLLMTSAQTGPSWRMIAVWSMLLMPYTAFLLADYGWPGNRDQLNKALAVGTTALVIVAFVYDIFRIERASSWAFPESDKQAGQYLNVLTGDPNVKILIESSEYFFLNILVASQHPDAFVRNSVPKMESVPVLPRTDFVRSTLEAKGIKFLVFQTTAYKDFLNRSQEVAKLEDFGPWSIYELKAKCCASPSGR